MAHRKITGKPSRSIFRKILIPLSVLTVLDALVLAMVLQLAGVIQQLNQNSCDILIKQVDNRQSYLQSQMTEKWMKLGDLSSYINTRAEMSLLFGTLDLETLDSKPSSAARLILDVMDQLIGTLYDKSVSGIYVVFNTHDLEAETAAQDFRAKTGIYIRDNDPLSAASDKYADLLLECAPVSVVQSLNLSTDSSWEQLFKFGPDRPYESWLTDPYMTAYRAGKSLKPEDCGLWALRHDADGEAALSYTVPLVLNNGTVYGVLGVELRPGYLGSQMPNSDLEENGLYALFRTDNAAPGGEPVTGTVFTVDSHSHKLQIYEGIELQPSRFHAYSTTAQDVSYEAALSRLSVYSRNAPFDSQRWYVLGAVPTANLFAFSEHVWMMMVLATVLMLVFGIAGTFIASWLIARPITTLRRELESTKNQDIPQLSPTGIAEVDDFAEAITGLSRDVVDSSRRFLSIMEMSSIDMGGYELDESGDFLFVTDTFFRLFGMDEIPHIDLNRDTFHQHMLQAMQQNNAEPQQDGSMLYSVPDRDGKTRYIHVQETRIGSRRIGVAEDITDQVLERQRIEHERDYDILTGICNRRAFRRDAGQLLASPEQLGTAVMVMIDLDNLKNINDSYGHEWGDRYIVACARCISAHVPAQSVISRVSGDEFNLLLYGFRDRDEARQKIANLDRAFHEARFELPDGKIWHIGASGGYCFVEPGAMELAQLTKFADFAMYLVKHGKKGQFGEFDRERYAASRTEQIKHRAFQKVIREESIHYVFQPIVDARTGGIHAVEALMRVQSADISDTGEFMSIARKENALDEVERLTWYHALEAFHRMVQEGIVDRRTRLFVNSQVDQLLPASEQQKLINLYGDIRPNTVMEVVETSDYSMTQARLRSRGDSLFATEFALDDFGTGYNNEKNLLELMPQYVKLDITLVQEVNRHPDRQMLISGIIAFAHERHMTVLAEGVETEEELTCLLELGVDMLQGFLLARPSDQPNTVSPAAVARIRSFHNADR